MSLFFHRCPVEEWDGRDSLLRGSLSPNVPFVASRICRLRSTFGFGGLCFVAVRRVRGLIVHRGCFWV